MGFSSLLILKLTILVVSSLDCTLEPDGIYEKGCKSFLKCLNGQLIGVECHEHLVYNSKTQDCDDPSNVAPPCGHLMDCTDKADGHYPDLDQRCQTYYTCNGGIFFGHNYCPPGLVFHVENGVCDWPHNVPIPCGSARPTFPSTTTTEHTSMPPVPTSDQSIKTAPVLSSTPLPLKTASFIDTTANKHN